VRLLASLSESQNVGAETLHRLRTDLRRLEAWLDLAGDHDSSAALNETVSLLSPLRSLHALEEWLVRHDASRPDVRAVRRMTQDVIKQLTDGHAFDRIRQTLAGLNGWSRPLDSSGPSGAWRSRRNRLARLLSKLGKKPKRKRLHRLRLEIKQLRYQLEWMATRATQQRRLINDLKQAQRRLGAYEELASFRKLARQLELRSRPAICESWRRARKKARRCSLEMNWVLKALDRLGGRTAPDSPEALPAPRVNVDLTPH